MKVLSVRNVNEAYKRGLKLLHQAGEVQSSRAGEVLVTPYPVVTAYRKPMERVLFDAARDANPFFHLMESLWMLAGQQDATWLDHFVKDFSSRFAESSGMQHGAYGYRWRTHFILDGTVEDYAHGFELDQLNRIINMLRKNPADRRIVLQMWDPEVDLGADKKDVPCNLCVMPRIVKNKLDITVVCRSNDAIWGAYGANAVHFSVLQEYLAANLGIPMGTYYQVSNNFHAYRDVFHKKAPQGWLDNPAYVDYYKGKYAPWTCKPTAIVTTPAMFDEDLRLFFNNPDNPPEQGYTNTFFSTVAVPMFYSYKKWRLGDRDGAMDILNTIPKTCDWYVGAMLWYSRR